MDKKEIINAAGMHYTPLNRAIRRASVEGADEIVIRNVLGQRFIADGLKGSLRLEIHGLPGGDLGFLMSGPVCTVYGNCDHAPGNTMNAGRIVIHGSAGDAVAHSMRGGEIFVRDDIGYRGGIHMKEYMEKRPVLVVGGSARAFLGEYMAGGLLIVLGKDGETVIDRGIGSAIHGGEIYIRGEVDETLLGAGAMKLPFTDEAREKIRPYVEEFGHLFGIDAATLIADDYTRIGPASARPFAGDYTWE